MESQNRLTRLVHFGAFVVDLRAGELYRQGRKIKLQDQPFQLLAILLEHPGEVITRQELRNRIWPGDTFVDFDQGLNKAILKIRDALGDDADNPRFVETLPRRGYRFIAPVEPAKPPSSPTIPAPSPERPGRARQFVVETNSAAFRPTVKWWWVLTVGVVVLALSAILSSLFLLLLSPPRIVNYTRLTHGAHVRWGPMGTDGTRIYFNGMDQTGEYIIGSVSSAGGDVIPVSTPLKRPILEDVSSAGTELLVSESDITGAVNRERRIYIVPIQGGSAQRIGSTVGSCATWSTDAQHILYCREDGIHSARRDGSDDKKIANLNTWWPWPRSSPDGRVFRFDDMMTVWEARMDGSNLRPVLPRPEDAFWACCGAWTRDGRYFLFEGRPKGARYAGDIWAFRERQGLFGRGAASLTFAVPHICEGKLTSLSV